MPPAATDGIGFCSAVQLNNCDDLNNFFANAKAQHYLTWFNGTLANEGPWKGVRLVDTPGNELGFHLFWNRIDHIFGGTINLIQFAALMSVLANEVRADFSPQSERIGRPGHTGLAYPFDKIPGLKRSYNTLAGNRTSFQCFNDPAYLAAHGTKAGSERFARTTDARWKGEAWPSEVSTKPNPAENGFLMEADFMKFRGRGFIQTTGRANYKPLIEFVQNYQGDNGVLRFYQLRWAGKPVDKVAYESSNEDWDTLFQRTDLILASEAVRIHNVNSGGYLTLSSDPAVLNGRAKGSLFHMGKRVSGSADYAAKFQERVAVVLSAIAA